MNLHYGDALWAEVNYRHERARASWPVRPKTTSDGAVERVWSAVRRRLRQAFCSDRLDQNVTQSHHQKDETSMSVRITRVAPADEALIHGVVADIEHGFNDKDPELLVRHIDDETVIVSPAAAVLRGRLAIEQSAQQLFINGPLAEARVHYRLTEISLLAPGVAVAQKHAWNTPEEADDGAPPQMIGLYVFIHRHGRWWISRRQTTKVR